MIQDVHSFNQDGINWHCSYEKGKLDRNISWHATEILAEDSMSISKIVKLFTIYSPPTYKKIPGPFH